MPNQWTRRSLLRTLGGAGLVALAGVSLAACGGAAAITATSTSVAATSGPATSATASSAPATVTATSRAAVAAAGITLDFWNPATDELGKKIIADQVAKFNGDNRSFQVKDTVVGGDNNYQKYTAAMAGGAPPDAIMTYSYNPLPVWVYGDALQPLDSYMAQMKINKADYFPIVWSMIYLKGHLWGFLQEFDSGILAWNKSLFQKNGLDPNTPPKTIAELDDMIAKLTQRDSAGNISQLGMVPGDSNGGSDVYWLAAFGGMYYDTLTATFTINTPKNVAALDWMAGWWKKLGGHPAIDAFKKLFTQKNDQNGFTQEKQGLSIQGEYNPIVYQKEFPTLTFGTGFLPVQPSVFYGTGIAGGGNVFCIPKGVGHLPESITFSKYMGGPDAVLDWNVRENNLPPVTSVALDPKFAKQVPLMKVWLDMLKLSAQDNHLVGPITHPAVADFNRLKGPIYNKIIGGTMNARDGLAQLEQLMQPVLAKYQ